MVLINLHSGQTLADQLDIADQFWTRFKGLMFTKSLPVGNGLMIKPCQSIHTFFMRYAIDVIYLDGENNVIEASGHVEPGKMGKMVRGAQIVIELPSGTIEKTKTKPGDRLQLND